MGLVAAVQMVSSSSIKNNLIALEGYCKRAADEGVVLLALPENFAFMGLDEADKCKQAEVYGRGDIQQTVSRFAERFGLWIVAGTIPLKTKGSRVTSTCLVYSSDGECQARYDKIHLFDVSVSDKETYQESLTVAPGKDIVTVNTPVGCLGLTVCYDLRFPELYHKLLKEGAEIFVVPSAFTAVTGAAHWEVLLRARAIENLCYVLAPNQGGLHDNGRKTYGHSMIIEPWGGIMNEQLSGDGLILADIDLHRLHLLKNQFPSHKHHVLNESKALL